MKLEILQKLIALANNNPNENEANLAARKACKALADGSFTISESIQRTTEPDFKSTRPSNPPPRSGPYRPTGAQWDFYEEFFRSAGFNYGPFREESTKKPPPKQEEPPKGYQKYKPKSDELREREFSWQYEYYVANKRQYYNPLTQKHYNKMFQDLWFEETGRKHESDTAAFRSGANYGKPQDEQKYDYRSREQRERDYQKRRKERGFGNEDRKLKCKTCGREFNSKFVGLEDLFECNECTWTAFERNKQPPKEEKKYGHVCHMTGRKCNTPVTCAGMGCQVFVKR